MCVSRTRVCVSLLLFFLFLFNFFRPVLLLLIRCSVLFLFGGFVLFAVQNKDKSVHDAHMIILNYRPHLACRILMPINVVIKYGYNLKHRNLSVNEIWSSETFVKPISLSPSLLLAPCSSVCVYARARAPLLTVILKEFSSMNNSGPRAIKMLMAFFSLSPQNRFFFFFFFNLSICSRSCELLSLISQNNRAGKNGHHIY